MAIKVQIKLSYEQIKIQIKLQTTRTHFILLNSVQYNTSTTNKKYSFTKIISIVCDLSPFADKADNVH